MLKDELHVMLGGNIIDVELNDDDYTIAIANAEEAFPFNTNPIKHRRLALAECLSILGLARSKFPDTMGNSGQVCLEQANIIREELKQ